MNLTITRKKGRPLQQWPAHWTITDSANVRGRWMRPGTEFSVTGKRGRFRFIRHVSTATSEWVDGFGADQQWHSIHVSRIRVIHVSRRMR